MHDAIGHQVIDSNDYQARLLAQLGQGTVSKYERCRRTLLSLPADHIETLRLVYEPSRQCDLLRGALGPDLARLGPRTDAARRAFRERYKRDPGSLDETIRFLEFEAGKQPAGRMFRDILRECERIREPALGAYDVARLARVEADRKAELAPCVRVAHAIWDDDGGG